MRRLLIYCQDGMGLGHLRRARNIAAEVVARAPGCAVLVASDSPAVPFFSPLPGVDHLKLPTLVKTGSASWRAGGLSLDVAQTVRLRAQLLVATLVEFGPDVVLVDHMPVGALGELKPLLDHAARGNGRPGLFLGLRDVLDAPEVIQLVWSELDAYALLERYDAVLVYGCQDIYDAAAAYGLRERARDVTYCNYVASTPDPAQRSAVFDEPLVLVMGGGGGDAFTHAATFLEAFPLVLAELPLRAAILPGPNMPLPERRALAADAAVHGVEVGSGFEDALPWLRRASAVVTMAGYNSLCEALRERKKALALPRAGPSAEQRIRSRLFAERRLLRVLEPEALTSERLAEDLLRLLTEDGIPDLAQIPPLDGAARAASVLVQGAVGEWSSEARLPVL